MKPPNPSAEIIEAPEISETNDATKPSASEKPTSGEDDLVESEASVEVEPQRRPFERPIRVIHHNFSPPPHFTVAGQESTTCPAWSTQPP